MADTNGDGIDDTTGQPVGGLDPQLLAFLSASGLDPQSLLAPTAQPTSQADIAAAALDAARAMSQPYSSTLPWWAQGLRDSLISQDQFPGAYSSGEGLVYLDTEKHTEPGAPVNKFATDVGGDTGPGTTSSQDFALTVSQAEQLPYMWSNDEVISAIERLKAAGLQVDTFDDLVSAWSGLVDRAAKTYALTDGQRKLTPWDVLDIYKNEGEATGSGPFSGKKTTVQRNVTEITEGEAWANIQNTLSSMLGRDPSDQETRDFTYRMNQLAAENPSISRTVTRYKNGEAVSSSTHTDPGFTSADVAQEAYDTAQDDPEYAEFRGASYLFNAAMSALGPLGG